MIDTSLLIHSMPALLRGAVISLKIAGISCALGLSLGIIIGLILAGKMPLIRPLAVAYNTVMRGTPMLIQIYFALILLPEIGITSKFWIATLAIAMNSAAYISYIIQSGIASVSKGQIEAARSLGISNRDITQYIVLPQAISVVLPSLGNEFITLIKDSSLASLIGVMELTKRGNIIKANTFDVMTVLVGVSLVYMTMTTLLSIGLSYVEKRMNRHVRN